MAIPTSHPNPQLPLRSLNPPSKQKPTTASPFSLPRFLFKALFLVFLLLAVPLFPSQAPAFLDHRVFTDYWELLHLLFIGVAVSYGLFGRRSLEGDGPENAERHASWSASRVGDFLPIFEDGYEISCGSDGKFQRPAQEAWKWDSAHYSQGESKVAFSDKSDFADEKQIKSRSLSSENGGNVVSSWSSQYFQCEPMVVVAQPNFNLGDEYCKPLGLPVRSLRLRTEEPSRRKSRNGGGSGPVYGSGHSSVSSESRINGDFGDVDPVHLEKIFGESVAVPSDSSIPWQSRSGRTGFRESSGNVGKNLHARHHRSRSFRSSGSLTSHAGSASSSSSPDKLSPSHSTSSDLPKMEDSGSKKDRFGSSHAASPLDVCGSLEVSGYEKGMGRNLTDKGDYSENVIHGSLDIKSTLYSSSKNRKASPDMTHSQRYEKTLLEKLNDERMDLSEKRSQDFLGDKLPPRGSHSRSYTSIEKFNDEQMDFSEKRYEEFSGGKLPPLGCYPCSYTSIEKQNDEWMDLSEKSSQEFSGDKLPRRGSHSRSYTSIEKFNDEQMDYSQKRYEEFSGGKLPPLGAHSRSYTSAEKLKDEQMDLNGKISQEFSGDKLPSHGSHSRSYTSIEKFNDEQMDFSQKRYEGFSDGKLPPLGSHSRSYTITEKLNDERMDLSGKISQEYSGDKLPPRGSHSRSYTSIDAFLDGDGQRKLKGDHEDLGRISRENLSHRRGFQGSLKLDVKPRDKNIKGSLRGKSVRTFRPSRRTEPVDKFEQTCQNFMDEKVGMKHEKTDQFCMRKEGNKTEGSHSCFSSDGKPSLGNSSPVVQQEFADCANGEKKYCENKCVNSGEEWMAEAENARRSLDKEAVSDSLSDVGTEAYEVDKKAGEFIAKFREQIRRQKMASMDGSVGVDISEDDYR